MEIDSVNKDINIKCIQSSSEGDANQLFDQISSLNQEQIVYRRLTKNNKGLQNEEVNEIQQKRRVKKVSKKEKKEQKRKRKDKNNELKPNKKKLKKLKRQKSSFDEQNKEIIQNSSNRSNKDEINSDQYSSEDLISQVDLNFSKLNPSEGDEKKISRLKKNSSSKKHRLQLKQGFQLQQLGNDPVQRKLKFKADQQDFQSFSQASFKKTKKKLKKEVVKNQQMLNRLMENGNCIDDQQDSDGDKRRYYTGMQLPSFNRLDKSKKSVKMFNKMFEELDFNKEEDISDKFQEIALQYKTKTENIKNNSLFIQKAERLKKLRGMQSKVNQKQYECMIQQKNKKSLMKIINGMQKGQDDEDIDILISVPTIVRGKSSSLINNAVFLKKMSEKSNGEYGNALNKIETRRSIDSVQLTKTFSGKGKQVQRGTFFREINQQIRLRRSKYISDDEIKNCFKKSKLQELEEARKLAEEKRKKAALVGSDFEDDQQNDQDYVQSHQNDLNEPDTNSKQLPSQSQHPINPQNNQINNTKKEEIIPDEKLKKLLDKEEGIDSKQYEKDQSSIQNNQEQNAEQGEEEQGEEEQQQEQEKEKEEVEKFSNQQSLIQRDYDQQIQQKSINLSSEQMDQQEQGGQEQSNQEIEQIQQEKQISQKPQDDKECQKSYMQNLEDQEIKMKKERFKNPQNIDQQVQKNKQIDEIDPNQQQRQQFKKLRKIATIIAQKKRIKQKNKKKAQNFFEDEAQLGSDNEQHDYQVKKIDYEAELEQYKGVDLDADLEQLIDNAVDINEQDEELAFRKYLQDVRLKDRQELRKIINGEFKEQKRDLDIEIDQDEKDRLKRMDQVKEWIKKRQDEDQKQLYVKPQSEEDYNSNSEDDISDKVQSIKSIAQEKEESNCEDEQLAIYLEDIMAIKQPLVYSEDHRRQIIQLQSEQKVNKIGKRNSLLGLKSSKTFCGFVAQQSKVPNMKLKKTSSSSLNQIIMKNKQKNNPILVHPFMKKIMSSKKT